MNLEDRLDRPLANSDMVYLFAELEAAWLRIEGRGLDWLLNLGGQLSDEQIADFLEVLWENQDEFEGKYLERSDEEFYEESYDNFVDNSEDFLGRVSEEQREKIRAASNRLLRSDQAWLAERADWLKELEVLLQREPGWEQAVKDAVATRRANPNPDYLRIYEHNMGVIFDAIAELLNSRSDKQDKHLRGRLSDLREDLETLVAQGSGQVDGCSPDIEPRPGHCD